VIKILEKDGFRFSVDTTGRVLVAYLLRDADHPVGDVFDGHDVWATTWLDREELARIHNEALSFERGRR
jgi:hypothetical protein